MWYPGKNVIQGVRNIGHNVMDRRRDNQAVRERAMAPAPGIPGAQANYAADRSAQGTALAAYAPGGPSAAMMQQQAGQQQNIVDQMGMAANAQGGSLASQSRQVAGIGAAGGMAMIRDAAMLAAQEEDARRAGYAQQANTMAGMSGGFLGQNASLGLANRGMDIGMYQGAQQNRREWVNSGVGAVEGAAQAGMFSDLNLKTDVRDAAGEAGDTLASLHEIGFRYKDKRHGPDEEETIGIPAQDLLTTPGGRRIVKRIPGEGLAVDIPGGLSLVMAHGSDVEKRIRKLEGRG